MQKICNKSKLIGKAVIDAWWWHWSESSAVTASQLVTSGGARHSPTTPTSPRPKPTDMTCLPGSAGSIVLGYRGTFAFGRDGMADVCFRKLTRILVHGKVRLWFLPSTQRSCVTVGGHMSGTAGQIFFGQKEQPWTISWGWTTRCPVNMYADETNSWWSHFYTSLW